MVGRRVEASAGNFVLKHFLLDGTHTFNLNYLYFDILGKFIFFFLNFVLLFTWFGFLHKFGLFFEYFCYWYSGFLFCSLFVFCWIVFVFAEFFGVGVEQTSYILFHPKLANDSGKYLMHEIGMHEFQPLFVYNFIKRNKFMP